MNGVGFAGTSLAVCKNCAIVTLQATLRDGFGYRVEDDSLVTVLSTDEIKVEVLAVHFPVAHESPGVDLLDDELLSSMACLLPVIERPDSDADFDVVLLICLKDRVVVRV